MDDKGSGPVSEIKKRQHAEMMTKKGHTTRATTKKSPGRFYARPLLKLALDHKHRRQPAGIEISTRLNHGSATAAGCEPGHGKDAAQTNDHKCKMSRGRWWIFVFSASFLLSLMHACFESCGLNEQLLSPCVAQRRIGLSASHPSSSFANNHVPLVVIAAALRAKQDPGFSIRLMRPARSDAAVVRPGSSIAGKSNCASYFVNRDR